MTETPKYWFPAKRYGWGWGPPRVWQGWVVLLVFFGLLVIGAATVLPAKGSLVFLVYMAILCAVLMAVCWIKGERPRWRWGGDK